MKILQKLTLFDRFLFNETMEIRRRERESTRQQKRAAASRHAPQGQQRHNEPEARNRRKRSRFYQGVIDSSEPGDAQF